MVSIQELRALADTLGPSTRLAAERIVAALIADRSKQATK